MVSVLSAYLDTCVVSALVKNDIDPIEQRALHELFARYEKGELALVCSQVVDSELSRIPPDYKGPQLRVLALLRSVPRAAAPRRTRLGPLGLPSVNPRYREWKKLTAVLPDDEDAWHVFVASQNRVRYVVTVDQRTMLSRAEAVRRANGVHIVRPSELLHVLNSIG